MKRAGAVGVSANRITRLRDADSDGVAEVRDVFLNGLNQPFGMALVAGTFYVATPMEPSPSPMTRARAHGPGRKLVGFKPGGHWTRSLLASPDGSKLYVGVGSLGNIGEDGMAAEEGRAAIYEIDLASGTSRIFATGLRNPVGLAWEPHGGTLDGGQRARWPRRRDAAGLPDVSARRRLLRLALLLLGADGGRSRAAGPGLGREGLDT